VLSAALLATGLVACGGDDGGSSTSADTTTAAGGSSGAGATATAPTTTADASACTSVDAPEPRTDEPDLPKPRPAKLTGAWKVTMTTNCGSFTIALDTKRQPRTTASFKSLVAAKFYDGLTFHRIVPGLVVQGGDPQGDGFGGPGYDITETTPPDAAYTRGVVAMAKGSTQPAGTSGSQFFVVTAPDAGYATDYAIVGKVVSGMGTIDRISALASSSDGPPSRPVVVSKAVAAKG
jgi:peptidyl-prolyl cis-trans isomerase B (cyclophilin B)